MNDDEWDLEDDAPPSGHDTVKLAQALRGGAANKQTLGQVVSRMSASELPRLSSDFAFPQTGPPPDSGAASGAGEEDEEEEDWNDLRDELVDFFAAQSPAEDAQGLYAAQKDAFERCMATVDCSEALAEGLAQTVRNLVELAVHLMGKCAGTESELLQAVARLEERRARHEQLKGALAERKKEAVAARGDCRRLERELEAAKLRAERAEMQAELYQGQAASLKQELSSATLQLEQVQASFHGLRPKEEEMLARITLRGKGVAQQIESQQQQAQMNLAALTAELEALELSPRVSGGSGSAGGKGGSSSGAVAAAARGSGVGSSAPEEDDSGLSDTGGTPREARRSEAARYQQLVNELVADNELLQREYLELLRRWRGAAEGAAGRESNEAALLRAARARLENALREALRDKALLEAALVAQVRARR